MTDEKENNTLSKGYQLICLVILIVIPVVFWILPADQFDESPDFCPSALLFDMEFFDCGTIKALQHIHHFEFGDALYFHFGSPLIYGLLAFFWGSWTYHLATRLGLLGAKRAERVETNLKNRALKKEAKKRSNL